MHPARRVAAVLLLVVVSAACSTYVGRVVTNVEQLDGGAIVVQRCELEVGPFGGTMTDCAKQGATFSPRAKRSILVVPGPND